MQYNKSIYDKIENAQTKQEKKKHIETLEETSPSPFQRIKLPIDMYQERKKSKSYFLWTWVNNIDEYYEIEYYKYIAHQLLSLVVLLLLVLLTSLNLLLSIESRFYFFFYLKGLTLVIYHDMIVIVHRSFAMFKHWTIEPSADTLTTWLGCCGT